MNGYEFLKYLTVNLSAKNFSDDTKLSTATGFYAVIKNIPVIVTAKHFANSTESLVTLPVHYKENDTVISFSMSLNVEWAFSDEYDIACCKIKPIQDKLREITGKDLFYTAISEKDIVTKKQLSEIAVLSEVLTIGYPKGESSTHHEFPLFKKGYLSSLPRDTIEDNKGYLDICVDHGHSGAPIFLNNAPLNLVGLLVSRIEDDSNTPSSTARYVPADKILEIEL